MTATDFALTETEIAAGVTVEGVRLARSQVHVFSDRSAAAISDTLGPALAFALARYVLGVPAEMSGRSKIPGLFIYRVA